MATPYDYSIGGPQAGWEIDADRHGGVRGWDPRGFDPTHGGTFYRPTDWKTWQPQNKTPVSPPTIGLPQAPLKHDGQMRGKDNPTFPGLGMTTNSAPSTPGSTTGTPTPYDAATTNSTGGGSTTPDLGAQTPFTTTPGATSQPYYNNSTGQEIGQYYGVQLGPGQIGFGNPTAGTTPTTTTTPTTPPTGFVPPQGTYEEQLMRNVQQGQGAWDNGMTITNPQDWQNFKFSGDNMSQWMRNANMIENPLDRFRYMFGGQTGGATGHNESKMAMIRAGIDPQVANRLADVFMGNSEGENYASGLGIGGSTTNRNGTMFQVGNQLWGTRVGPNGQAQRYLVKDFGGNNWESGHQVDLHPEARNKDLMDWYGQGSRASDVAQWFRGSSMSNPGLSTGSQDYRSPGTLANAAPATTTQAAVNTMNTSPVARTAPLRNYRFRGGPGTIARRYAQ